VSVEEPVLPARKLNAFERIAGVLFSPGETFDDIARRPDFVVPLVLFVLLGFLSTAIVLPRFDYPSLEAQQARQMRKKNPNVTDADIERISRFTKASTKVVAWIIPVVIVCWYALVAGVLLLGFRLFGGEGRYAQAFSATLYAWIPLMLFSIISGIVTFAQGTFDPVTAATQVKSNLAFLVDLNAHPVLYTLLASFDVFTIWTIVLLVFGFAALSRTTKAKAATIVVSLWLALIVVRLGLAALNA
jgi:hypothetical protein